jgi:hypothetical protein
MGIAPTLHVEPGPPRPFPSDDELLETARSLFHARRLRAKAEHDADASNDALQKARRRDRVWTRFWHRSLERSNAPLARRFAASGLDRPEKEVVAASLLGSLDLIEGGAREAEEIARLLRPTGRGILPILRLLSESGTLASEGWVTLSGLDGPPLERDVEPAPEILEAVLGRKDPARWRVRSDLGFERRMTALTRALYKKADLVEDAQFGWKDPAALKEPVRRARALLDAVRRTLRSGRRFRVGRLLSSARFKPAERVVLLALVGKELGHLPADCALFTRINLVRAAVDEPEEIAEILPLLSPESRLLTAGWVVSAEGEGGGRMQGEALSLGPKALAILGRPGPRDEVEGPGEVRKALLPMASLVLPVEVRESLDLAVTQIRHGSVLLERWGLSKAFPYGRAVTLLFHGPPGTGKTAAAEALAHETEKPLISVRYDRVQSRWIGETEKNIVGIFRQAKEAGAVLLWDEADAMFFSRESLRESWDVRNVNILLQEIERFEGPCVLTTNRDLALDPALDRRIAMKVRFPRPDQETRLALWRALIPAELPLGDDVDLPALSETELTGGEIKNVVLNAARFAVAGGADESVGQRDLLRAVKMEVRKKARGEGRIGFSI